MLFLYEGTWGMQSSSFEELFDVSIQREEFINTGGRYILTNILPSYLEHLKVIAEGSSLVMGSAFLETTTEGGEEVYVNDKLVFLSSADRNVTFLPAVRTIDLDSSVTSFVFFDDFSIEVGDNGEAALTLLNHLLE